MWSISDGGRTKSDWVDVLDDNGKFVCAVYMNGTKNREIAEKIVNAVNSLVKEGCYERQEMQKAPQISSQAGTESAAQSI